MSKLSFYLVSLYLAYIFHLVYYPTSATTEDGTKLDGIKSLQKKQGKRKSPHSSFRILFKEGYDVPDDPEEATISSFFGNEESPLFRRSKPPAKKKGPSSRFNPSPYPYPSSKKSRREPLKEMDQFSKIPTVQPQDGRLLEPSLPLVQLDSPALPAPPAIPQTHKPTDDIALDGMGHMFQHTLNFNEVSTAPTAPTAIQYKSEGIPEYLKNLRMPMSMTLMEGRKVYINGVVTLNPFENARPSAKLSKPSTKKSKLTETSSSSRPDTFLGLPRLPEQAPESSTTSPFRRKEKTSKSNRRSQKTKLEIDPKFIPLS